jgi:DNA-directed RNA polymerase subunit beta
VKVNNKINKEFKQTVFSNLVSRRDYSKIDTSFFVESDLLENQIKSYNKFLKQELDVIFSSYFPISHPKNPRYEVRYNGFKVKNPTSTEEEARDNNRSYEYPLYVDLSMIDNETGEIKKNSHKKSKKNDDISDGLTFFANIPAMTKSGSFVVNGCEKIVISQLTRSPGVYIFNKSQIKLVSKKKINTGRICEIFPSRGTLINL